MTVTDIALIGVAGYFTIAGILACGVGRAIGLADRNTPTFEQATAEACALTDPIPYMPVDESLVWSAADSAAFREWAKR